MDETSVTISDLGTDAGELRSVHVRTSRYVFELTRTRDGSTRTSYQPITETTPGQSAGATEHPRSAP